jgi:hypothetical protein
MQVTLLIICIIVKVQAQAELMDIKKEQDNNYICGCIIFLTWKHLKKFGTNMRSVRSEVHFAIFD